MWIISDIQIIGRRCLDFLTDFRQMLRQPRLPAAEVVVPDAAALDIVTQAQMIATANIRRCLEVRPLADGSVKKVLCAGTRNFREPWARDFGFATFGLLAMGEAAAVRECLEAFLIFQKASGQFPVKLHSTSILERYLHSLFKREQPVSKPLRPKYQTAHRTISLDGNCLLVIAALHYVKETEDYSFLRDHWDALSGAILWLETHALAEDGLLHQDAYTDWADSIGRTGRILYTNILYWKAVSGLAEMSSHCEADARQSLRAEKAQLLLQSIQSHFWRDDLGYFITSTRHQSLSSSGNALAIAWGAASRDQAKSILDKMRAFKMAEPVPTQVVSDDYPRHLVAFENRLAGIADYHMEAAWLWLGGWHVAALVKSGRYQEARVLLERISAVVVRDGVVHEVYGKDGRFLSTLLYTSEAPLSWNAAVFVYALTQYNEATLRDTSR